MKSPGNSDSFTRHGVGAGVGVGIMRGAGVPLLENTKVTKFLLKTITILKPKTPNYIKKPKKNKIRPR